MTQLEVGTTRKRLMITSPSLFNATSAKKTTTLISAQDFSPWYHRSVEKSLKSNERVSLVLSEARVTIHLTACTGENVKKNTQTEPCAEGQTISCFITLLTGQIHQCKFPLFRTTSKRSSRSVRFHQREQW